MTRYPCTNHPCDHCTLCDVQGVCCATVTTTTVAVSGASPANIQTTTNNSSLHVLRSVLEEDNDAGTMSPSLRTLFAGNTDNVKVTGVHVLVDDDAVDGDVVLMSSPPLALAAPTAEPFSVSDQRQSRHALSVRRHVRP